MAIFLKDPAASIDYAIDWAAGYLEGQTIAASTWAVRPEDPGAVLVTAVSTAPTRTSATLAGGERGKLYRITNTVTLSDGRSDERTLDVRVEDR